MHGLGKMHNAFASVQQVGALKALVRGLEVPVDERPV
jgi:hypothetical protein